MADLNDIRYINNGEAFNQSVLNRPVQDLVAFIDSEINATLDQLGSMANENANDYVLKTTQISTGSGLNGGGNLNSNRTLSVDNTVLRTTGDQTKTGTMTLQNSSYANALVVRHSGSGGSAIRYSNSAGQLGIVGYQNSGEYVMRFGAGDSPTIRFTFNTNGHLEATQFVGSGAGLTSIPAGNLTGSVLDARLPKSDNWDAAYNRSVTAVSGSGNGTLTLTRQGTNLTANLSHNHNASEVNGLAAVATSNSYADLDNLPTINGGNWDAAFSRSVTAVSGSGNGTLTLTRAAGNLTADLSHTHGYSDLPFSAGDMSNWNTAYSERGSQIAGTGLSWSSGNLKIQNPFNPSGNYANLRARATTASDVGAPPTSRTITAGDGLSGGGSLAANRTLSVDSTVVRTSGNQSISGTKTFTAPIKVETDMGSYSIGGGTGNYQTMNFTSRSGNLTWYVDNDDVEGLEWRVHKGGSGFDNRFFMDFSKGEFTASNFIGSGSGLTGTAANLRAQATTKADVGLSNVPNWSGSTSTSLGTSNTVIPSQGAVKSYVDSGLSGKANTTGTYSIRATGTTKADVGLSGIPNTNGSTSNFLRGDGSWTTPPNTVTSVRANNTGTYRTGNINLIGGSNVTVSEGSTGQFTISAAGTNLSVTGTGSTRTITSSTGSNTNISFTAPDVGALYAGTAGSQARTNSQNDSRFAQLSGDNWGSTGLGGFGLGSSGSRTLSNADEDGLGSGFYRTDSDTSNTPSSNGVLIHSSRYSSEAAQIYANTSGSTLWFRTKYSNYRDWQQVWTSSNLESPANLDTRNIFMPSGQLDHRIGRSGYSNFMNIGINSAGDGEVSLRASNGNTMSSLIFTNNNITANADLTAFSDARLKDDIKAIPDAVEKVQKLNGYTFTRNDQEDKEKRHTGVIAQEVLEVLPEAVLGGPTEEEPDAKYSVAYGNMVGLLIEAIKELKEEVNELRSKVEE